MAQEEESHEVIIEGRNAVGSHRSILSQVNEYIGQISERNRVQVEENEGTAKGPKGPRGGRKQGRRDDSVMELKPSESNISVSLSETADTAMVASQISPWHQTVESAPSVFNSKTARRNYLQRRKQATKPKPSHRKAWEFFRKEDDD